MTDSDSQITVPRAQHPAEIVNHRSNGDAPPSSHSARSPELTRGRKVGTAKPGVLAS